MVPSWYLIGLDFQHNYAGVTTWLRGENPYKLMTNHPVDSRYVYPPLTLGAFIWTGAFPLSSAIPVTLRLGGAPIVFWITLKAVCEWPASMLIIVLAAVWWTWRMRWETALSPLPLVFIAGAALLSYPMVFEFERGNCNVLVLLATLALVLVLRRPASWGTDFGAALCIVVAIGIKAYPGLLIVGLVALKRYRAVALTAGLMALMIITLWPAFAGWSAAMRAMTTAEAASYVDYSHTIAMHWHIYWRDLHLPGVASIPATPAIGLCVLMLVLPVSWQVFRAASPLRWAWPYLLWLMAIATFVPRISIDYNLLFVPFALFAMWDSRDPWWAHVVVLACALWCQPLHIGISGVALLALKFVSVSAAGLLLRWRIAREQLQPKEATAPASHRRDDVYDTTSCTSRSAAAGV